MRPEDITEQDENETIKDTEGQPAADENRDETVETEASREIHSEYKDTGQIGKPGFLSFVGYVSGLVPRLCLLCNFGACRSAYQRRTETRTAPNPALDEATGRWALQQGGEHCRTYHAIPPAWRRLYR